MIPFQSEPIEAMRARFPAAIKDVMNDAEDPRLVEDPAHRFDFDDGYRLLVCRDRMPDGSEYISVCGAPVYEALVPITVMVCRVGINFAELTDMSYGQAVMVSVENGLVNLSFKFKEAASANAFG